MKQIKVLAATLTLAVFAVFAAHAADQFGVDTTAAPSSFIHANLLTNSAPFAIVGSSTTNVPVNMALIRSVSSDAGTYRAALGFGVYLRTGGTNASDTTNLTVTLEGVMFPTGARAGGTQVVDNATFTVSTPAVASALPTGYDYTTNISPYLTTASQMLRVDGVRVRSIQNTNLNTIWLSNFFLLR